MKKRFNDKKDWRFILTDPLNLVLYSIVALLIFTILVG